jgi:Flp pilus assembly protein TadG
MSIANAISRTLTDRSGAAGVEFALMLPALVLFAVGTVDVGALAYQSAEVEAAAQAGARYAMNNGAGSLDSIAAAITGATSLSVSATPYPSQGYYCDAGGSLSSVPAMTSACSGGVVGSYVTVSAQATYTPVIAWSGLSMPSSLSSQTMVRVQ